MRCAAASASRHGRPFAAVGRNRPLVDVLVDGTDAHRMNLVGKPDPALFLEAVRRLRVDPVDAAMVEDSLAGVEAGRRGHFGPVIGLDRTGGTSAAANLRARGADAITRHSDPERASGLRERSYVGLSGGGVAGPFVTAAYRPP
ncbi:HAD-IA family hydrolase [Streptomyces spororaveus]|nr:HAD-IA family hydrolase [Streptomyces spororaveus]